MPHATYLALIAGAVASPLLAQNALPVDVAPRCVVNDAEFASWFEGGDPESKLVLPALGLEGRFENDCDFYKWGARTFLWLTSPDGNQMIFDNSGFFDVLHVGAGTEKVADVEVVPNTPGQPNRFAVRDVKPTEPLTLKEMGGGEQAGGNGVLISQAGSLTYYGLHVNDAYVAFRDAVLLAPNDFDFRSDIADNRFQFPTSSKQLDQVIEFGEAAGLIKSRPVAKAAGTMELKTSWVDAATVENPDEYLIIDAQVPRFIPSGPDRLTLDPDQPTETLSLAMVGMHIAAPVVGHPELVWTTYEHVKTAPMGTYHYITYKSAAPVGTVSYPQEQGGWIFAAANTPFPDEINPIAANITAVDNALIAADGSVAPQSIAQVNPWGMIAGAQDDQTLSSNTDLISLNVSLLGRMGDARDHYLQMGGVWTTGSLLSGQDRSNQRGGLFLANSTMETFRQWGAQVPEGKFRAQNCLDCHSTAPEGSNQQGNFGLAVSHIFQGMAAFTQAE